MMPATLYRLRRPVRPGSVPSGFTLIEMLVVIALAAIVLAIGVPSFRDLIVGQRVKAAAFAFTSAAVFTRSEAIKRNAEVRLAAAAGGWQNGWSVQVVTGAVVLSQQEGFPAGVSIASVAPKVTATQVIYQANGRLSAAVDDLQVNGEAGSHARCISFDLGGLPKSRMGSCS